MADQIIIEFIADTSKLTPATDQLEQQGKVTKQNNEEFKKTNAELLKQQKALEQIGAINKRIEESGKVTKKNLSDLAKVIKQQSGDFQKQIQRGIVDALHEAGVSVEEFSEALEGAVSPTVKQRLKELVAELAEMKAAGQDNTEQYRLLAQEAGNLKDIGCSYVRFQVFPGCAHIKFLVNGQGAKTSAGREFKLIIKIIVVMAIKGESKVDLGNLVKDSTGRTGMEFRFTLERPHYDNILMFPQFLRLVSTG